MELIFNELSVVPFSANKHEAKKIMTQFAKTFKKSRGFGFKRIRSDVSVSEIQRWLNYGAISRDLKDFVLASIITPFIKEVDDKVEDAYIEANYFYNKNGENKECAGLAAAYLYELPSISLDTSQEWQRNKLSIIVKKDGISKEHQIPNVFSESCFDTKYITSIIENLGEVVLVKSPLKPNEKDIHLANHHGKNELQSLCRKLKHSEYVVSMRSNYYGGKSFIRKVNKNGVVEITLVNSQRKYSLQIQTTGRNYRETEAIAKKLEKKYS